MDEQTKHIVASNLTIAFCNLKMSNIQQSFDPRNPNQNQDIAEKHVMDVYHRFLKILDKS